MEDLLKQQKQIIKATSFKETRQKIVRLQHFTQYEIDEIQEKIDLNQGKEIRHDDDFVDFECLLFTEPQEHKDCKEQIERARQSYDTTSIVIQNDDVSTTYFDNKIETIKDINDLVDTVYEDNKRRAQPYTIIRSCYDNQLIDNRLIQIVYQELYSRDVRLSSN
ncbi:MAG: hypothetical protein EZS28_021831 [Streblomastix strix]|uniref:Uncharacterized protein n=1 Tax=Streblomastix strix TaxID=222440 RepID=A0A5J4VJ69_9EUKA|nr:MAG: hypothetical protein EZS28_021831 [Streblomastix strix]